MKLTNLFTGKPFLNYRRTASLWLFIFAPAWLGAQQKLSLNDAISEGLAKNFQVNIAKNESDIARRNINPGNAGFLPSVTAYGSVDKASLNARVRVITGAKMDLSNAIANVSSAGIKAQWVLFDGSGMFTEYEKLKELWRISDLETKITMENVVSDIIVAYCGIIREQKLLSACQERLDVSNFRFLLAIKKLESGSGSEIEWLQSRVLNQADSSAWTKQIASYKKSKILLNQLLASDMQRDFTTEDSISLVQIPELDQLIMNGLQLNSSYKHAVEQVELSKLDVKSLKSGQYPKLSLTGSYGYYENKTEAAFINYNRNFGPQVGVNLGLTIFDGNKLRHDIQNAQITSMNRELLLKEMENDLKGLITQTYLDYQSQFETIAFGREGYRLALKNLNIAREAFQSGMVSSLYLREVQEELFHAASRLVNAYYDARVKETELLRLSGMLIR
jgi:outer membrane protein